MRASESQRIARESAFELTEVRCDLCGSALNRPVMRKRGRLVAQVFSIVRCNDCGLVFVSPRIRDEDIPKLYDDAYFAGRGFDRTANYAAGGETLPVMPVVMTLAALPGGIAGKLCLDVGCGNGALVQRLRAAGAQAFGSETAAPARAMCEARGIPLVDLDHAGNQFINHFDIVTATEVIEHVTSPTDFLISIAALVKPGGIIFLTTGNWSLVSKEPGTPYVMPEGHLTYFTPVTLAKLFEKVGLIPVFDHLNRTWFPVRVVEPRAGERAMGFMAWLARLVHRWAPQYGPFPLAVKLRAEGSEEPAARKGALQSES